MDGVFIAVLHLFSYGNKHEAVPIVSVGSLHGEEDMGLYHIR